MKPVSARCARRPVALLLRRKNIDRNHGAIVLTRVMQRLPTPMQRDDILIGIGAPDDVMRRQREGNLAQRNGADDGKKRAHTTSTGKWSGIQCPGDVRRGQLQQENGAPAERLRLHLNRMRTFIITGLILLLTAALAACGPREPSGYRGDLYFGQGPYLMRFSLRDGSLVVVDNLGDKKIRDISSLGPDKLLIAESASVNRTVKSSNNSG